MKKFLKKWMKLKHPINLVKYKYVQVYWNSHWSICLYAGWEPICKGDFRLSIYESDGYYVYEAIPFNNNSGKACSAWKAIHESRVLPFEGIPTKNQLKSCNKYPFEY